MEPEKQFKPQRAKKELAVARGKSRSTRRFRSPARPRQPSAPPFDIRRGSSLDVGQTAHGQINPTDRSNITTFRDIVETALLGGCRDRPGLQKNVSHPSPWLGQYVIRSIRCDRAADTRPPQFQRRWGFWVWQREMRQQNQNSQNEPGMSFEINETEKTV